MRKLIPCGVTIPFLPHSMQKFQELWEYGIDMAKLCHIPAPIHEMETFSEWGLICRKVVGTVWQNASFHTLCVS